MRIARVRSRGVKSADFDMELTGSTLLLGPVGAGKSRVTDAIRFAATGCVPHLGRREQDTARIMRGDEMDVTVTLEDGRWFRRTLTRAKGKLTGAAEASWVPKDATATAHAEAIRGLFGESDDEAAEHLDLRELMAATPAQRAARIEKVLAATASGDAATGTWAAAVARLSGLPEDKVPSAPLAAQALAANLKATLEEAERGALDALREPFREEYDSGGIPRLIAWANEGKRTATTEGAKKRAARAELEDRAAGAAAPARTLDQLDAERAGYAQELAGAEAKQREAERTREPIQRAEQEVSRLARAAAERPTTQKEIEEGRKAVAEMRAEAERVPTPPEPAPKSSRYDAQAVAKVEELRERAKAATAEHAAMAVPPEPPPFPDLAPIPDLSEAAALRREAEQRLALALKSPWQDVREVADTLEERTKTLPCRVLIESIRRLRYLATEHGGEAITELERQVAVATEGYLAAAEVKGNAITENASRVRARDQALAEWRAASDAAAAKEEEADEWAEQAREWGAELDAEAEAAHAKATKEHAAARRAAEAQRKRLRDDADALDAATTEKERALAELDRKASAARAHLDGLRAGAPTAVPTDDEVEVLRAKIAAVDEQRRAVQGADARARELTSLARECAALEADVKVYAALEWAAKRTRERDLADRSGPIIERMRTFLRGAGRPEEPYLRAAKGVVDFGWRRGGAELPVEALSGGETVMFTAALAAAVVSLRGPEVRCLIIEAAEAGPRLDDLLAGCEAFSQSAHPLDTTVVACVTGDEPPSVPMPGWQTVAIRGDTTATVRA